MKTPNELNKIYDRLPKEKIELSKVELKRIELGIVDDIEKMSNKINAEVSGLKEKQKQVKAFRKELTGMYKTGEKLETVSKKDISKADKLYDQGAKLIDKAEQAAKDLGVDFRSIKGFSAFDKAVGDLEVEYNILEDDLKEMFI